MSEDHSTYAARPLEIICAACMGERDQTHYVLLPPWLRDVPCARHDPRRADPLPQPFSHWGFAG